MRMENQDESRNVEDVRASGFRPIHGIGLGTVLLALIGGWIFGVNPLEILGLLSGTSSNQGTPTASLGQAPPSDDAQVVSDRRRWVPSTVPMTDRSISI